MHRTHRWDVPHTQMGYANFLSAHSHECLITTVGHYVRLRIYAPSDGGNGMIEVVPFCFFDFQWVPYVRASLAGWTK